MMGVRSNSALFWAFQKARVQPPLLILSALLGTPENAGVTSQFHPLLGPRERGVRQPLLILVPFVSFFGEKARATQQLCPLVGP